MAAKNAALTKETLLGWYEQMVLIRKFEEKCRYLYFEEKERVRRITGVYLHLASGNEALHLGSVKALTPTDHVITAYRDHAIGIARGVDPNRLMAEMLGRRTGVSGGKGGSMHLASRDHNFWGGYAIVGGHLPLATGIALKCRYMDEPNAVLCFCGDGATNNGYFHEAVNLAAVWKLPVVWLIENNQVGMGTRIEEASSQVELNKRAIAYGMEVHPRLDGQNVIEVYNTISQALHYAKTNGPVLIEAMTYRFQGHGVSDKSFDDREDLKAELQEWLQRDPNEIMKKHLTSKFKGLDAEFTRIEAETDRRVDEAVEFAVNSPVPDYDDLIANVYVDSEYVYKG